MTPFRAPGRLSPGPAADPRDVITRMVLSRFSAEGLRQLFGVPDRIDCDWSRDMRVVLSSFEQETLDKTTSSMTMPVA